ncbi:hypothetical protein KUF83_38395 [Streptomyces sp. BV286]|uniref:hypothetical protein n=1 Tax=Streptomyces sp. BV286 TaxID=2849672 RepID=UPI001C2E3BE1|nr:hypothetical protein [Streptomyces sp. BV286]MBV1942372.1 hypothetical protein [Streptomyces sp. BV286]
MPHGCGHGPDNGSADCGHDGDSGWGWSGGEATRDSTHRITIRPKHPDSDFYFMLVVAVGVLGFLAWILSPIYM